MVAVRVDALNDEILTEDASAACVNRAAFAIQEKGGNWTVGAISIAALVVDFDTGHVHFRNQAAIDLIGATSNVDRWDEFLCQARAAFGPDARAAEFLLTLGDGRAYQMNGACEAIPWGKADASLLVLLDLSKGRDAQRQVAHLGKLARLGEMSAALAHELSQPLSVIKIAAANAQRIADGECQKCLLVQKLARIDEQVERARRTIDHVRRFARAPSADVAPFKLRHSLELGCAFVAEQYRVSGLRLILDEIDIPASAEVIGDESLFEQVIVNLLTNARDAFEGQIRHARLEVKVVAACEGDKFIIDIVDNAGGIPECLLDDLFQPFVTCKPSGKGTGLGLAISWTTITNMGGSISAWNNNEGAQFRIILPRGSKTTQGGFECHDV